VDRAVVQVVAQRLEARDVHIDEACSFEHPEQADGPAEGLVEVLLDDEADQDVVESGRGPPGPLPQGVPVQDRLDGPGEAGEEHGYLVLLDLIVQRLVSWVPSLPASHRDVDMDEEIYKYN